MTIYAVMMGRGGSSMPGKNIAPVLGIPLLAWAARTAHECGLIDEYYFSSDDDALRAVAESEGYLPIERPAYLASDSAQGCDVLIHALEHIFDRSSPMRDDLIVMQHANSATYTPDELAEAISLLKDSSEIDCVAPAHLVDDYHPYRQKKLVDGRYVENYVSTPESCSTNRQDLPQSVAFNHSFWVVRATTVLENAGMSPWTCMGNKVRVQITEKRNDVHSKDDLIITGEWIRSNYVGWQGVASPVD